STENSGKFVNGILDSVKADVEQQRAAILGLPDEG
ncbi:MAG: hypothetical protein KC488_03055, partial [Candidatus Cloacimonetes bacterium]|nr:hypothetical protein [Candidatus Cloacimonadota bacterium]